MVYLKTKICTLFSVIPMDILLDSLLHIPVESLWKSSKLQSVLQCTCTVTQYFTRCSGKCTACVLSIKFSALNRNLHVYQNIELGGGGRGGGGLSHLQELEWSEREITCVLVYLYPPMWLNILLANS